MMIIVASMYGFFTAFVILRTIVLVDLLGLDKLTSAFGLLALFEGTGEFNVLGISSADSRDLILNTCFDFLYFF